MNWLLWLLIGLIVGWLIEFVIDYLFWQRRCSQTSDELNLLQRRIGDLEARALAAERDTENVSVKLNETKNALDSANADLAASYTTQENLRQNVQILEERVDDWGRKIGLLAAGEGLIGELGAAFSQDQDEEIKSKIDLLQRTLNGFTLPELLPVETPLLPDPLHEINGIGAVYEKRLNDAGIFTFHQLITAGAERVHEIIAPKEWQNIDAHDWLIQAQELLGKRSQP